MRVHAESTDQITGFFRAVEDLALIKRIGDVGKNFCGELYADTDIDPVGFCRYLEIAADLFHPFRSAAAAGNDTDRSFERFFRSMDKVISVDNFYLLGSCIEVNIDLVFQFCINVLEYDVILVCPEVTNRSVQ